MTEPEDQLPSRRIAAHLRASIVSGKYEPGDRIPSERTLAVAYGCARNTVRDAVRILRGEGLVTAEQGYGVIVLPKLPSGRRAVADDEPSVSDEPEHLREYRVVLTATAVTEAVVFATGRYEAAARAVELAPLPDGTGQSVTIGEWLVDTVNAVHGRRAGTDTRPPCTCPGIADQPDCPRHGDRARIVDA
jgi:DNA-binding FadR family transcriptional regulator